MIVAASNPLRIARRKVAVEVTLIAGRTLAGSFYADVCRSDGSPGRVVDRLNRGDELFIPLAIDDRHILIRKSAIARIELEDEPFEVENGATDARVLTLEVQLLDGTRARGIARALLPASRSRALDYLNLNGDSFVALESPQGTVTIVNGNLIEAVVEELSDPPLRAVETD